MVDQLEKNVITIVNFVVSNNGKQILTVTHTKKSETEIPPGESHTFDSAGVYVGRIDGKPAFELIFREGTLAVHKGKATSDGGEILISATLT